MASWLTQRRIRKAKELADGDGYIDVVDLYEKRLISIRGAGHSITHIDVQVISRVDISLNVSISYGTYFVAHGNYQNMATREQYKFALGPSATQDIAVEATCIDASKPIPSENDRFGCVKRLPKDVRQFLEIACHADAMTIQAGVWALTDHLSRDAIRQKLRSPVEIPDDSFSRTGNRLVDEPAISHSQIDIAMEFLERLQIAHNLYRDIFAETAKNNSSEVQKLLAHDPRLIDAKDYKKETPLHIAALYGHAGMVKLLLENQANIDELALPNGGTPLHSAVDWPRIEGHDPRDHVAVVEMLLSHNARVNLRSGISGETPLHLAATRGDIAIGQLLLAHNADINAKSKWRTPNKSGLGGSTPLHNAAITSACAFAQMLLDHKADINAKDEAGRTPLDVARQMKSRMEITGVTIDKKYIAMVELLERSGRQA